MDMVVYTYKPSSWEVEVRGAEVQDQPQPHNTLYVTLNYLEPYLKNKQGAGEKVQWPRAFLLLQRTQIWFIEPMAGSSQSYANPTPGYPMPFSVLYQYTHTQSQTH